MECAVLSKHVPIKEKNAKKSAWLTEEITAAQKNRDYYHKQDWENFKLWRNKTKSLIRTAGLEPGQIVSPPPSE